MQLCTGKVCGVQSGAADHHLGLGDYCQGMMKQPFAFLLPRSLIENGRCRILSILMVRKTRPQPAYLRRAKCLS